MNKKCNYLRKIALIMSVMIVMPVFSAYAKTDVEITFRGIPWNTPARELYDNLWYGIGSYKDRPADDLDASFKYGMFFDKPLTEDSVSYFSLDSDDFNYRIKAEGSFTLYSLYIPIPDDFYVAGYVLKSIHGAAVPSVINGHVSDKDHAQVLHMTYSFNRDMIDDRSQWFSDMTDKLTSLYGEPDKETIKDDNHSGWRVWFGMNDTYVILSKGSYEIRYGLTNEKDFIDACIDPASTIDHESTDGL